MTREEFNQQKSYGDVKPCPDCRTVNTQPFPNCGCPTTWTPEGTPFTQHIYGVAPPLLEKGDEMSDYYILDENKKTQPATLEKWAMNFKNRNDRRVDETWIGDIRVSTVFLGIDHRFDSGPPMLFETMVFGGLLSHEMERYSTWEEAVAGHVDMVKRVEEMK